VGADALFAFDESTLSPDADKTLAALGPLIRKNAPDHTVRVDGYTDAIGSDAYNMTLSLARAKTVRDWLAKDGDIGQSTAIEGHGKENPVAPNTHPDGSDDPAGRQKNRRVEVVILGCTR
jgi:outer membrane protein OmpA-like peptidoglycan-associated protein